MTRRLRELPIVTLALCVVCTAVYALAASGVALPSVTADSAVDFRDPIHVVGLGARSTPLVADTGESFRILTCHFVHTSWPHLLFNLAFLFPAGAALEHALKRSDYVGIVLVCAVGSSMASLIGTPQVSAGASGIVFGLLGASVTFGVRHHRRLGARLRRYYGWWVLPFVVIVLGLGIGNPTIDHASHLGGLITGLVAGTLVGLANSPRRARLPAVPSAAVAAAVIALLVAPALARDFDQPRRVTLDAGGSIEIPTGWARRYGPLGEVEFTTAAGMVVLTTGRAPPRAASSPWTWYERHRLEPLGPAGRAHAVVELSRRSYQAGELRGERTRYRLRRDGTPMIRDVYFLENGRDGPTVLSLETPLTWAPKYAETEAQILGSLQTDEAPPSSPHFSVAAIQ